MQCDKKTFLTESDTSKKRNLIWVGGYADNAVDLCGEGNADAKLKCGLSPSVVDDPLFRKALVTTVRMGQSAVRMGKGTALGKRDTTLTHRHTFALL